MQSGQQSLEDMAASFSNHTAPLARRVSLEEVAGEPFRLFFPAAVLAGLMGVLLWPLHFLGVVPFYPGLSHARLMGWGFFGGFVFGFLGTAMPRMLSVPRLRVEETTLLFILHTAMEISFLTGHLAVGDILSLALLATFLVVMARRFRVRRDNPPPAFILVAMAMACAAGGAIISLLGQFQVDLPLFWVNLQRLLSYQGFVLLPILGVGGFILPRFFGMPSQQDFPESLRPPPGWTRKAFTALGAGVIIVGSFVLEAAGWHRTGHAIRAGAALAFLFLEMPLQHAFQRRNALATSLLVALAGSILGLVAVALFPSGRVALLHLTLAGGFAALTFAVATRVVFGHSGNQPLLRAPNRWMYGVLGLMLLGTATRISGDFWPNILPTHYSYGAILWGAGAAWWAWRVLPNVLVADDER